MKQLIIDLLNYSRVGTRGAAFQPINMQEVARSRVANLKPVIADNGATVTCDSLPVVHGDETQLVQVLQNLIGNGIKFHGEQPPRIDVSAHRNGKGWEFAVRDNGIGIDAQYWEQIFVIFQRLHTRQKYAGNRHRTGDLQTHHRTSRRPHLAGLPARPRNDFSTSPLPESEKAA